jgi:hypothetical protein
MERKTEFISLLVVEIQGKQTTTEPKLRFINRNHIMQIRQDGDDVILELTDYEKLKIRNENIHVLMDRFI